MKRLKNYFYFFVLLATIPVYQWLTLQDYQLPVNVSKGVEVATVNNESANLTVDTIAPGHAYVRIDGQSPTWVYTGQTINLHKDMLTSDTGIVHIENITGKSIIAMVDIHHISGRNNAKDWVTVGDVAATVLSLILLVFQFRFLVLFEKQEKKKRKTKKEERKKNPYQMDGDFLVSWNKISNENFLEKKEFREKLVSLWKEYQGFDDSEKKLSQERIHSFFALIEEKVEESKRKVVGEKLQGILKTEPSPLPHSIQEKLKAIDVILTPLLAQIEKSSNLEAIHYFKSLQNKVLPELLQEFRSGTKSNQEHNQQELLDFLTKVEKNLQQRKQEMDDEGNFPYEVKLRFAKMKYE